MPSRQQIIDFVRDSEGRVGKREIGRAFGIKGADRIELKRMLKELTAEGAIDRGRGREIALAGALPDVSVLHITGTDIDGELLGRPAAWDEEKAPPKIIIIPPGAKARKERGPSFGRIATGDRILAHLTRTDTNEYEARVIKRLDSLPDRILGVFDVVRAGGQVREGRIRPANKRLRDEFAVPLDLSMRAEPGEIVVAEAVPGRLYGLKAARVVERIGHMSDPRSLSLIAIHANDIPTVFSEVALAEAHAAQPVGLAGREDLTKVPLVTIDPDDARDHDDAVFAQPDDDPANPGGWHVIVAIADVSWYVRPNSALDRDAQKRGNSTYFPDRVSPMLPEALSADLCSLVEGKPRACLAVHMWFGSDGRKRRHRFSRALMRSLARLSYGDAQSASEGRPNERTAHILDEVIRPLYAAYALLAKARDEREPLAIDLPERRVMLGSDGYIAGILPRERFESHRLIEEFMIQANVAAAEELERLAQPCMYRVHEEPSYEKLDALRDFLSTLGYRLAKGQALRPMNFNQVLRKASGTAHEHMINQVVLRSQSQAIYSPNNLGHFGLNLRRYAHFTSPIRRYADLLVHRALVSGLKLGDGGLSAEETERFASIAEHISTTERRSMAAEREALERFTAVFMRDKVGTTFGGRITGVTRFGLFIGLDETGADGLVPIGSIGSDFYIHDEARHTLTGRSTREQFRLGDQVMVKLVEATPVTGGLRFELVRTGQIRRAPNDIPGHDRTGHGKPEFARPRPNPQGRPKNIRLGKGKGRSGGKRRTKGKGK